MDKAFPHKANSLAPLISGRLCMKSGLGGGRGCHGEDTGAVRRDATRRGDWSHVPAVTRVP